MRSRLGLLFCVAALGAVLPCRATVLPDSCGNDKVTFDVSTKKGAPPPATPADGKALFVFVETFDNGDMSFCLGCSATVRVGVDGSWVGASKGPSYFAVPVAPGEHHVCVNWQSSIGARSKNVGMASLTAEAGKVYYFESRVAEQPGEIVGTGDSMAQSSNWTFALRQLSQDEGKYQVKLLKLATAKQQ